MKKFMKNFGRTGIAMVLTICMVFGLCATGLVAAEKSDSFNYVSLGASNTNGYGMRGYLDNDVYNEPWSKGDINIYGYQKAPEGSYPDQVRDYFTSQGYNVNLDQLAMSSMRSEEIRFLLDSTGTYKGDSYTDWRFYDVNGDGNSQNWFVRAGKLAANNENATDAEAIAALRNEYRTAVANADLITLDIGANNFGVYVSNHLMNGMFQNDFSVFSEGYVARYETIKSYLMSALGSETLGEDMEELVDTMAYALSGYCMNFDEVIKEIRALNPDAEIVVLSIKNPLGDLQLGDGDLPLSDLFAIVINAANLYTSIYSPVCDEYSYADVSHNSNVAFFVEEIKGYNGDPATLSQNMIDCFNVYDDNLLVKTRVQQGVLATLDQQNDAFVTMTDEQKASLDAFTAGLDNNSIKIGGLTVAEFETKGKAGKLTNELATAFAGYERALAVAYDVVAEIMQLGAEVDAISGDAFSADLGKAENALLDAIFSTVKGSLVSAITDPSYQFDLDSVYPQGFLTSVSDKSGVSVDALKAAAALGVRTGIGNSFFDHPGPTAHSELAAEIFAALGNQTTGLEALSTGKYKNCTDDNYYVSLGGNTAGGFAGLGKKDSNYTTLVADHFGFDYNNLGQKDLDALSLESYIAKNAEEIKKATIITYNMDCSMFFMEMMTEAQWDVYLGAEGAALIAQVEDTVFASLGESMDSTTINMVKPFVDNLIFAVVSYALEMNSAINEIHDLNSDALVLITGMYNPLRGITATMEGETIDVGELFDTVMDSIDLYHLSYVGLNGRTVFVDISDAEIVGFNKNIDIDNLKITTITGLLAGFNKSSYANAAGHAYIAEQIIGAVDMSDPHTRVYDAAVAATCEKSGLTEGQHCEKCGMVLAKQEKVDVAHVFEDGVCIYCGQTEGWDDCPFTDIGHGTAAPHWAYDYIHYACANGLMNGTSETTFEPETIANRAMIVTILWRLEGSPVVTAENKFSDLEKNTWYTDAMLWATENGILNGYEEADGTFTCRPLNVVTREQFASFMYRYAKNKGADVSASASFDAFPDGASVASWSSEAMSWAVASGLINGVSDKGTTMLQPQGNTTRAQVATVLYRLIEEVL